MANEIVNGIIYQRIKNVIWNVHKVQKATIHYAILDGHHHQLDISKLKQYIIF